MPSLAFGRLRGAAVIRDPDEEHRAATPLELLFDLTFVVAVSRAAAGLHHELAGGHVAAGVVGFAAVFFAAWWVYFDHPGHLAPRRAQGFRRGYGHVVVFASLAAAGAGIQVAAEAVTDHAPGSDHAEPEPAV